MIGSREIWNSLRGFPIYHGGKKRSSSDHGSQPQCRRFLQTIRPMKICLLNGSEFCHVLIHFCWRKLGARKKQRGSPRSHSRCNTLPFIITMVQATFDSSAWLANQILNCWKCLAAPRKPTGQSLYCGQIRKAETRPPMRCTGREYKWKQGHSHLRVQL
jgi:hypothetical protein